MRLIRPSLQIRLIGAFVALSAVSLLLQFIVLSNRVSALAEQLPQDGALYGAELSHELVLVLATSFLVLLPLTFWIGVVVTHRIAGPLYRFEVFLKQVQRGERPAACHLRQGDELKDLCELLNQVTEPLRKTQGGDPESSPATADRAAAACDGRRAA